MSSIEKPSAEDMARTKLAQAIKGLHENWAFTLEMIGLKAKTARARYLALRREGFEVSEALQLCLKDCEL